MKNKTWWANVSQINFTASIDDGSYYDLEIAKLFKSFGIPVTMYLTIDHVGMATRKGYTPMTSNQAKSIARITEIGSHTVTHPLLTRVSPEDAYNEILDSKNMLEATYNKPVTKFCYPRGYANPEIQNMVKEVGYKSARSTIVGYLHKSENPYFEQTTLHAGCDRKEYAGMNWYDYGIKMYEESKHLTFSDYHIWLHGWEIAKYPNGIKLLKKLLKEITK